jgi:hypothetical protein
MIKTLLNVLTMSVVDLTRQLKEAEEVFEEALTSLQQDGKLVVALAKAMGMAGVAIAVALHQAGRQASPLEMSVGAVARWGIGRVSAARSPGRSRHTSCKMRRRPHSCLRQQP